MKHALIQNGIVAATTDVDSPGLVFGSKILKHLRLCPQEVEVGWHYDGTDFTPPSAEEVAEVVREKEEDEIVKHLIKVVIALVDKVESGEPFTLQDIPQEIRQQVVNAVQRRRS